MGLDRRFCLNGTGDDGLAGRHRKANQTLAERFQQLDEKIVAAEEYFRSLHLPRPIYAAYNDSAVEDHSTGLPTSWESLSFERYKGKWRLCHAKCFASQAEEGEEPARRPLVECAADLRLEALSHLAELKAEAAKSKERYIDEIDKTLAEVDRLLSE